MSKIIEAFLDLSTMSIVHMFKWLQYYEEVIRLPNGKSIRRHMSTRIEAFSDLSTNVYRTHVHVASVLSRSAVTPYIDILRVLAAASVHNNGTRKNRRKILPISLGMFLGHTSPFPFTILKRSTTRSTQPALQPPISKITMSKQDFDRAIRCQALRQTLSDVLDVIDIGDHGVVAGVNQFRNPPSNFAGQSFGGGRLEAPFLSPLNQLPPSQLGASGITPLLPLSSMSSSNSSQPVSWQAQDSEAYLRAAVAAAERRRLGEVQDAIMGYEMQKRQTLIRQQQQRDSFFSLLQGVQPMHNMAPSTELTALRNVRIDKELCQGEAFKNAIKVCKVLGSSSREKTDPYIDISEFPVVPGAERQAMRGGVAQPFPEKLYVMLQDVENEGKSHIASFYPHGRAFGIHDMKAFVDEILPKYFVNQTKLVSFVRQLNLYGFARIHSGQDQGGFYHELFLEGRPEFFPYMRRSGASKGLTDRRRCKDRHVPGNQPDFYAMKPIRRGQLPFVRKGAGKPNF
jgi:hypothetical protein